ncbi:fungal-specific transcription factor domain-containing protein [Hypoxylon crocopeplum]|nr:fungal-specific transcription factor domain-containing protein [Hypoxylon crocopeplum]
MLWNIMTMDLPHGSRHNGTIRSSNGCWTCRLRRKKCDEKHPVCDVCDALHITCHYAQEKPEWMDGGVRQEEMAEQLKREVREKAHLRRGERTVHISGDRVSVDRMDPCLEASTIRLQRGPDCTLLSNEARQSVAFGRSDTILLTFYLEHLFPFLFPFYRPSLLQGGRSWILEMMISSPVVRQTTLCESSYFFSLARGTADRDVVWEKARDAFELLRESLQVINGSDITVHLHGAARIMASIMQVQRFEIAALSFNNCHAHLSAALALFKQLLDSVGPVEQVGGPGSSFGIVISRLGPTSWILPSQRVQVPSAEQAAFRFSSALLVLDDIVASTMLQEQPRLYEYHRGLLGNIDGTGPAIDLETSVGCQNWALLQIGEIAVLDAWKQQRKRVGNLDVMELVHRATAIKDSLETHLARLDTDPAINPKEDGSLLDVFTTDPYQKSTTSPSQSSLATRVWAHAALIYLFVVVSGWQPASVDMRYHVGQIIELLAHQISPPSLLRTMVWPFCVAGCVAEPAQEASFRGIAEALQPPSVFGTVRKALEIMANVWCNRDAADAASRDLATCFRSQGDLALLV